MKKTMMLLLCLLIVVSLFATTALAAAITPRGSEGAAWTNKTIRQTYARSFRFTMAYWYIYWITDPYR